MSKIIAITNQKGGVGKTTTSINLAASLGILEKKTLLIDADPQGNTTASLISSTRSFIFETIDLFNYSKVESIEFLDTDSPNLKLLPTSINLINLEFTGKNLYGSNFELRKNIEIIKKQFDYIIIDCGPSLNFITTSFLCCADSLIIPIQCEFYALNGLHKLFSVIKTIIGSYNPKLEIEGILITMYDKRLIFSRLIIDEINKHFETLVFKTIIDRNVKISESQSHSKAIINYDATCLGAIKYLSLANEIIEKNLDMNKFKLGKGIEQIIDDNNKNDDLNSIFEKLPINKSANLYDKYSQNFDKLIGLSKQDVVYVFGDSFNDLHSNSWMFRLPENGILKKKFLYLSFENNKVVAFNTTYFRKNDAE
jgi:chromosome partitioning protein